jgi:hypothetical protein
MTQNLWASHSRKAFLAAGINPSLPFRVLVLLLIVNIALVLQSAQDLPKDIPVFYWPWLQEALAWLQLLTCLSLPAVLVTWIVTEKNASWPFLLAVVIVAPLLAICVFANYFVFFLGSVEHVGTVTLHNTRYQLAKTAYYDAESIYYLGVCDSSGYWCNFHPIYHIYLFRDDRPEIRLSDDAQQLIIKANGNVVYTYDDSSHENCLKSEIGYCPQRSP